MRLVVGLFVIVLVVFFSARWILRAKRLDPSRTGPTPQIMVPTPESEMRPPVPQATESQPGIATISELAKPWASKDFFFRNRLSGESVPAMVIRLPGASATQPNGYWAFAMNHPFGRCQVEYVTDLGKLASDYGFRAKHPMVGNPCSRTVYDPLRLMKLPGNVWVRGAIAQGSDIRPPLGIELELRGSEIRAIRME